MANSGKIYKTYPDTDNNIVKASSFFVHNTLIDQEGEIAGVN